MKSLRILTTAALTLMLFSGCESQMTQSEKGALLGGALGSGLGAIIGHKTGSAGAGIAIGGVTGALAGGVIGHAGDQTDKQAAQQDEELRRQDAELRRQRRELEELKRQRGGDDGYNNDSGSGARDDYRRDPPPASDSRY